MRWNTVDVALTQDQQSIRDAVFPTDFYKSMSDAGWLGIAMPESLEPIALFGTKEQKQRN